MSATGVCPKDMDALLKAVSELHKEVWDMSEDYQNETYELGDDNSELRARITVLENENQELRERLAKYEKPEEKKVAVEMAVCGDCGENRPLHQAFQVTIGKRHEFCKDCFEDISPKRMEKMMKRVKEHEKDSTPSSTETLEYLPSSEEEVEMEPEPEPAPTPIAVTSAGSDYKPVILQNAERLGFNLNVNHVNYLNKYMNERRSQYNGLINNLDERRFIEWLQEAFQEEMERIMINELEMDSVHVPDRKWEELWKKKDKAKSCGGVINIVKMEWEADNSSSTPDSKRKILFKFCGESGSFLGKTNILFKQQFYKERIQ